jgi:hypothetical protein
MFQDSEETLPEIQTDDVKAAHQSKAVGSPGEIIEQK